MRFEASLLEKFDDNPRYFHSYVRHKKVGRPSAGPLKLPNSRLIDDPGEMAAIFSDLFSSVYAVDPLRDSAKHQICDSSICSLVVLDEAVKGVLLGLDSSSSAGPDCLHPYLLSCVPRNLQVHLWTLW